jgi:RimJ/RimL family protein N-acetyltransferase
MYSIVTDRLILRPFIAGDVHFLDYLHSDMDVVRYTRGHTRSHNKNIGYIYKMLELYCRNLGHLMIIRKSDNQPIGSCGYSFIYGVNDGEINWFYWGDPLNVKKEGDIFEYLELGYSIAQPFWRNGYASEADIAMMNYGYDDLKYDGFSSLVNLKNKASINVAMKMGTLSPVHFMLHDEPGYDLRNVKNG